MTRLALRITAAFAVPVLLCALAIMALARDDGRFAGSPLKPWFNQLASGKGLCCSFADGVSIEDVDWDSTCDFQGRDSNPHCSYRVRLNDQWVTVPDDAVVTEPNRYGPAVVWPTYDYNENPPGDMRGVGVHIRCFMPGAGT